MLPSTCMRDAVPANRVNARRLSSLECVLATWHRAFQTHPAAGNELRQPTNLNCGLKVKRDLKELSWVHK